MQQGGQSPYSMCFLKSFFILHFSANVEINKVRKQKEIDLAGLQAALKKAQSRINSLEQEVQQKVCFCWLFNGRNFRNFRVIVTAFHHFWFVN